MDSSYKHLDKDTLNALLEVHRRNLGVLEVQAAKHGSAQVPLVIANGIREAKSSIEAIEAELRKYDPNAAPENTKPKILAIDDDPTFLETISVLLARDGFMVFTATNGIEGVKLAQAEQPDLILLDIQMPDIDGYTVLAQIVERRIRTRVLIVSAYDNRVSTLIRSGACDFISKVDATPQNLLNAIRRSILLDNTVDVILDNPIKIINPLVERLELSYQNERHLKAEYRKIAQKLQYIIRHMEHPGNGDTSERLLRDGDDAGEIDFERLERDLEDYRKLIYDIQSDLHDTKNLIHRMAEYIRRSDGHIRSRDLEILHNLAAEATEKIWRLSDDFRNI